MKKITLLVAAFVMVAFCANAQLNNPKDADGYYIVKWDCASEQFATSNNFEVDETFTFAIDVTGMALEEWLKETPAVAGATRSLALNKWTSFGDVSGDSHRLKQIKGNIYGATWNFAQLATTMDVGAATTEGAETYVLGTVFGFEFTADSPGAAWWQNPIDIDPLPEDGQQPIFRTLPYTGTKTSEEFFNSDYPGLFDVAYGNVKGYAPACAVTTGIGSITVDSSIVGHEYYNIQGAKLSRQPESGLFIDKAIKADGSSVSTKILKTLK
ncbi:hypothetical protein AGMMS50262_16650 [Bacteroidia bacterium]|nr:hypothetical protein AGMMS50262_16650 [Bacteroidia bacterium]